MNRHLCLAPRAPWLASCLVVLGLALGLPAGPAHGQDCTADPTWFQPKPPEPDPNKRRDTNCAFHQWAVQEFLYQVEIGGPNNRVRFLDLASPHALFLSPGDKPSAYPGTSTLFKLGAGMAQLRSTGKANDASPLVFLPRTLKTDDTTFDAITQAGSNAVLVDQKGQWVYYTASVNEVFYNFVRKGGYYTLDGLKAAPRTITFPNGTLETKSAWRIAAIEGEPKPYIPDAAKSYYTTGARICRAFDDKGCTSFVTATMALVGLHLAGAVEGHPEMIWATFEHKGNAPDCKATPASPKDPYSFYTSGKNCGPSGESCNQKPTDARPSEICRVHPYGEPEASVGNTRNIQALNQSFHQQLPAGSVWRNYDYIGSTWTEGEPSDAMLVLANIRGSSKLANTSLESFTQDQSCFSCHNTQPMQMGSCLRTAGLKNLYLSHLFGLVCKRSQLMSSH